MPLSALVNFITEGPRYLFAVYGECARRAIDAWLPVREKLLKHFNLQTDALFFRARQENAAVAAAVGKAYASGAAPTQDELACSDSESTFRAWH